MTHRDRTGEPIDDEPPLTEPEHLPHICHEGWVEAYYDAEGHYLGSSPPDDIFATSTVYPCWSCKPRQFRRWRQGCYAPGHVTKDCPVCVEERARAREKPRPERPAPVDPEPVQEALL